MASYVVLYERADSSAKDSIVTQAIKGLGTWVILEENCYTVTSNVPPGSVRDYLRKHLDEEDCLYILPTRRPYASLAPQEIDDWLDGHLERS